MNKLLVIPLLFVCTMVWGENPKLTPSLAELNATAARIYKNETGGRKENLVVWNAGEEFPSLGIGHFIWFPRGVQAPFIEGFPALVQAYLANGYSRADLPRAMTATAYAPWKSRDEFNALKAAKDSDIEELIEFLHEHQAVQVRQLMQRLEGALEKMMAASSRPDHVYEQFYRVAQSPGGFYPLLDYVGFKGEGVSLSERYKGEGWGLLQVLETMRGTRVGGSALREFSNASMKVLSNRIANSPIERGEERWREGWNNRCRTYA